MDSPTPWPDGFSPSSQTAFRYAWAASAVRHGRPVPDADSLCSIDDLLVGTMLAHPGTSEAEHCFRHFGLVAGQVLAPEYPRLSADQLNRRLDALRSSDLPPLEPDVTQALSIAAGRAQSSKDQRVHLPFLWSAILSLPSTPLTSALMSAFATRGVELSMIQRATDEWLDKGEARDYLAWLAERFPEPQGPTTVVSFKADTTVAASSASGDLLQIGREVDAFAYLLAAKETRPPLAIGLFGDWGSGKTFFMNSVHRRIDRLLSDTSVTSRSQAATPFWKRVIQIDFNAWHYAEGDLLASLVDHIFTHLRTSTYGQAQDPVKAEEEGWLRNLDVNRHELETKRTELAQAEAEFSTLQLQLQTLESQRAEALETLDDQVANASLQTSKQAVLDAVSAAVDRASAGELTVRQARADLEAARVESQRALASIRWLGRSSWRTIVALMGVLFVPVAVGIVERLGNSGILSAAVGFAAAGFDVLALSNAFAKGYLDRIETARAQLEAEAEKIRSELQAGIDDKVRELDKQRADVENKQKAITDLESQRLTLQQQIESPAGLRIRRFLDDRIGSGEYRSRLGVPAIVRHDLERLSGYIRDENERTRYDVKKVGSDIYDVNRIVLYIDDLDRCTDKKVIEVLQAVHLLLAFELFIVVVAVDSRWLSYALEKEYPALAGAPDPWSPGEQARPRDYLEKIFQVPFVVRPLGDDGRTSIVRGLLGDHVRVGGGGGGSVAGASVMQGRVRAREAAVLDEQIALRQPPASLALEAFALTPVELAFVETLAPLLGDTPRAVKRFVNLYQLMRVLLADQPAAGEGVADRDLAAFLLATSSSQPDFADRLFGSPPDRLGALCDPSPPAHLEPVPVPVATWLRGSAEPWRIVAAAQVGPIVDVVRRFSFG